MVPTDVTTSEGVSRLGSQSRGFIVGIGLGLMLAVCVALATPRDADGGAICLPGRLNPNTATVSSLARLPGVGLARASAIVACRTRLHAQTGRQTIFRRPEDLQQIKGIGPRTAGEMAPWLDFGSFSQDGAETTPLQAPARTGR